MARTADSTTVGKDTTGGKDTTVGTAAGSGRRQGARQLLGRYDDYLRWLYRSGRPNRFARLQNRASAIAFAAGIWPSRLATLEVPGRRSGRIVSFPVVIAELDGQSYLVSMLGERAGWVRNMRAADGRAVLRHGRREAVHLEEVPAEDRPAILRRYLAVAPGARPHVPVDRDAPIEDFARVAPQFPVFRIVRATAATTAAAPAAPAAPADRPSDR